MGQLAVSVSTSSAARDVEQITKRRMRKVGRSMMREGCFVVWFGTKFE